MKVLVCGSRYWIDIEIILKRLDKLPCDTIIVEGGCCGADLLARNVALEIGLEVIEFPASWKKHGKAAGIIRNFRMLETKPELIIAFHDNMAKSKGTKHTVSEARKAGIEVEIISH
jgi:hypothetical protein